MEKRPKLTEYEKLRQDNIERNEKFLSILGVEKISDKSTLPKARPVTTQPEATRASSRASLKTTHFNPSRTISVSEQSKIRCDQCGFEAYDVDGKEAKVIMEKHLQNCFGISEKISVEKKSRNKEAAAKVRERKRKAENTSWVQSSNNALMCCLNPMCTFKTARGSKSISKHMSQAEECKKFMAPSMHKLEDQSLMKRFATVVDKYANERSVTQTIQKVWDEVEYSNGDHEAHEGAEHESREEFESFGNPIHEHAPREELLREVTDIANPAKRLILETIANIDYDDLAVGDWNAASSFIFDKQQRLLEEFKRSRKSRVAKDNRIVSVLHQLGMDLKLTLAGGDKLLATVRELFRMFDVHQSVFKRWDDLKKYCDGSLKMLVPLNRVIIPLPATLLGELDLLKKPLQPVVSYHLNILDVIALALLDASPDDFHDKPNVEFVQGQSERIYTAYPSGKLFQMHCFDVWSKINQKFVPLMVMIFHDSAGVGARNGTRSCHPVILFIMNMTGESFKPHLAGYCPLRLPYSKKAIEEMLKKHKPGISKDNIEFCHRSIKRRVADQYLSTLLEPLNTNSSNGFKIQIGTGEKAIRRVAITRWSHSVGDTEQMNYDGQVSHRAKHGKCRWCMCLDCTHYPPVGQDVRVIRSSERMEKLADDYQRIFIAKIGGGQRHQLTVDQRATIQECKQYGVIPGRNRLREVYTESSGHIMPFAQSLAIDILHTNGMGLTAYGCVWPLTFIKVLSEFDIKGCSELSKYRSCFGILDLRIKSLATFKEALYPTKNPWHYPNGVSPLLTVESQKGKNRGRATSHLGGIPGSRMAGLMFQIMTVLACNPGTIIPDKNITLAGFNCNPTQVICSTQAAILEVEWAMSAKKATESDFDHMALLIRNANVKLLEVDRLKQAIMIAAKIKKSETWNPPNILKCHLMGHHPEQGRWLGKLANACDTNIGESCMKPWVTFAFNRSSKVLATTEKEMLSHNLEFVLGRHLWRHQIVEGVQGIMPPPVVEETDKLSFVTRTNMGSVKVEVVRSTKIAERPHLSYCAENSDPDRFCHPLLTLKQVFDILMMASHRLDETPFFKNWHRNFMSSSAATRHCHLNFNGGLYCSGHESSELLPFYIRADRESGKGSHSDRTREPAFSSLEVVYDGYQGTTFVKVMAILDMYSLQTPFERELRVIVVRYSPVSGHKTSPIPYPRFKLEQRNQTLSFDFLPIHAVKFPAFMQAMDLENQDLETMANYDRRRYFCISFSRVVKFQNVPYETFLSSHSEGASGNVFLTELEQTRLLSALEHVRAVTPNEEAPIEDDHLMSSEDEGSDEDWELRDGRSAIGGGGASAR